MASQLIRDLAYVVGRIGFALLFLWSGYAKLIQPAATVAYMQAHGLPAADLRSRSRRGDRRRFAPVFAHGCGRYALDKS
jgi:uncharacterized membrane protein YphA (DoxX/SURF4 family)